PDAAPDRPPFPQAGYFHRAPTEIRSRHSCPLCSRPRQGPFGMPRAGWRLAPPSQDGEIQSRAPSARPRGRTTEQRDERAAFHSIASSARASSVSGPCSGASVRSGVEDEACAGIGAQEFVRYFGLSRLVERLTSAVQWNDVVDVHILDRRYRVAHIVFLRGCKVGAPDDCVNFVDARSRLGLFDRIDHPAMAAGGQYD